MRVATLWIQGVRNLRDVRLDLGPGVNLVTGPNGAGKTSLLEGVHILGTGRSFHSERLERIIGVNDDALVVYGELIGREGDCTRVGVKRDRARWQVRVNGEPVRRLSELSGRLPLLVFHPESRLLVAGAPKERRRFLDLGLFHVEHSFVGAMQRYSRALKQRNLALRMAEPRALATWTNELLAAAAELTELRHAHVEALAERLPSLATQLFPKHPPPQLRYAPGWPRQFESLEQALHQAADRERRYAHTVYGPHRGDIHIEWPSESPTRPTARGHEKLLAAALQAAQARLFADQLKSPPVCLADDLGSELDTVNRIAVLNVFRSICPQVLVTTLDQHAFPVDDLAPLKRFCIDEGRVQDLVQ